MSRSRRLFLVCGMAAAGAVLVGSLLNPLPLLAQAGIPPEVRDACMADVQRLCANVAPGGGRIIACLKQHQQDVSDRCKQAIMTALQQSRAGGGGGAAGGPSAPAAPAPAAPATISPGGTGTITTPSPAPVHAPASHPTASTPTGPGERYFLMKQVKIIDQGLGQGRPAYDLMIPTKWDFRGAVNSGTAEGGCYADWFSVGAEASSADKSIGLQMFPQHTWQYMDDPAGQRQMQMQNQKDAQVGMKPCPVRAPIPAAEFLRQDILPKYMNGKTVVSIDAFPELDQMVRYRLGLPPAAAGGNAGPIRTDAARARVEVTDAKGQPVEVWVTAAIVVRTIPAGRGSAYDWHAVMVTFFQAPKGKLDANDRLFKLILSTIRPEPEWQQWSNGVIASLYRKKQEELAKQAAIISQFQMEVAQSINSVVASSMAGANHAVHGESQIIRGVQTFRDPSTGATFELSNQFDHAWLNGTNEYVMSDDPTFSPNRDLTGNWTELQVVR